MNQADEKQLLADIAAVASSEVSQDFIGTVRMTCRAQLDVWKERCAAVDAAMVEHIQATGKPIVVGEIEYRAGTRKETKCLLNAETADAVFEAVGGDITQFAACLSSNAFLPGACRKTLAPDLFESLFETTEKPVLVEGKPRPQLIATNNTFSKRSRHDRNSADAATAAVE